MRLIRSVLAGVLGFTVLFVLSGCAGGGKAEIVQHPQWDYEHYERLAVLPVKATEPKARRDADLVTDRLIALLTQNRTFEVMSRKDMEAVLKEQDLSHLADVADPNMALPANRLKIAQALVQASITQYRTQADRSEKRIPRYAVDSRGRTIVDRYGRPRVAGETVIEVYRHAAVVSGSVRVVDAATGQTLFSYDAPPISREETHVGGPPRVRPEELATEAARELAVDLYKHVAPVRIEVKLKKDTLVVATAYFDGKFEKSDKLGSDLDEFIVAVRALPEECDRNTFRVAISEAEGRENLWEQEFTWSGDLGDAGQQYHVPMSVLANSGAEKFVAKLYSGRQEKPIVTRPFRVTAPKPEKKESREESREAEHEEKKQKQESATEAN